MFKVQVLKLYSLPLRHLKPAVFCVGLLFLGACQTQPEAPVPEVSSGITSPVAPASGQAARYVVRSDLSDVRLLVYRAGPLAALGHNHLVQAKMMRGALYLASDFPRSSFELAIPVTGFEVDAVAARSVEGGAFAKQPDDDAIAGTTKNMLGNKVLDAGRYPLIDIYSLALVGPAWAPDVTVRIKLHGVEHDTVVPVAIDYREEQIVVTAVFTINQTDFGITPLSVLGGALQVANTVKVRMRIVAQKS